ncbi:DUF2470 domain-containing protein [Streptomyces sp. DT24]|uniref:DUF2470 domain-containing protein n=1 Tax=Streptomyces sp. DT24 TaxID=3416520 RepID=UPI003CED68F7
MKHGSVRRPTNAERARIVIAAATSLTGVAGRLSEELPGVRGLSGGGDLLLAAPPGSVLAGAALTAPLGWLPATLHFTDVAPVPARDRVRARVCVDGRLSYTDRTAETPEPRLRFAFTAAVLETCEGNDTLGRTVLRGAAPDPLAGHEASMITHLVDDHADLVARLTRLIDPVLLQGVRGVLPWAIDRYGLTLRLERAGTHRDVRLPFPAPLRDAGEAGEQIRLLLHSGSHCRRRSWRTPPR